jgi:hypothetical protein
MDTFVAQAYGREDLTDARHTLINGLMLACILTPLLMLVVLGWPPLMKYSGISLELVGPMTPFLRALNWGSLPLLAYFALRRYLQAVNVVSPIMFAMISANIVNAIGDWILIYGHLGFQRWASPALDGLLYRSSYMALVLRRRCCGWSASEAARLAGEPGSILEECSICSSWVCRPPLRFCSRSVPSPAQPRCVRGLAHSSTATRLPSIARP